MKYPNPKTLTNKQLKQEYKIYYDMLEIAKSYSVDDSLYFYKLEEEVLKRGGRIISKADVIFN